MPNWTRTGPEHRRYQDTAYPLFLGPWPPCLLPDLPVEDFDFTLNAIQQAYQIRFLASFPRRAGGNTKFVEAKCQEP